VVARALEVLRAGGLLIFPTETLYALGGRALDATAAARVRAAKGRPAGQPLPLVAADLEQARSLSAHWPSAAGRLAAAFWPGPLTIVVLAAKGVPAEVTAGTGTVAVRVPGLPLATALCAEAGPLVSTSANRAGERGPVTCAEAVRGVGAAAALALDGGPGGALASTIVDLSGPEPLLVRAGAVPWGNVEAVLKRRS
jgi:L-threonylcarbamoyladenylate synthase